MAAHFAYMSKAVRMTTDVLISDDIIELKRQLDIKHYCRDAVFLLGVDAYRIVRKLQYANGEYLWQREGDYCTLLDHEVILRGGLQPVGIGKHTVVFTDRAYAVERGWIERESAEETIAKFLKGKVIGEATQCHEWGLALNFDDGSMMGVDISLDIAGDPYFRYELDGMDPYKEFLRKLKGEVASQDPPLAWYRKK